MKEQLKTAQSVWQKYLKGETKAGIARELSIPRNEVQGIIKYTTLTLYLSKDELEKNHKKELQELTAKANKIIRKLKQRLEI